MERGSITLRVEDIKGMPPQQVGALALALIDCKQQVTVQSKPDVSDNIIYYLPEKIQAFFSEAIESQKQIFIKNIINQERIRAAWRERKRRQRERQKNSINFAEKEENVTMSRVTCHAMSHHDNLSVNNIKTNENVTMSRVTCHAHKNQEKNEAYNKDQYNNDLSININNKYISSSSSSLDDDERFKKKNKFNMALREQGINETQFKETLEAKIAIDVERQRKLGSPIRKVYALRRHLKKEFCANSDEYEYWVDQIKENENNANKQPVWIYADSAHIENSAAEPDFTPDYKSENFIKIKQKIQNENPGSPESLITMWATSELKKMSLQFNDNMIN